MTKTFTKQAEGLYRYFRFEKGLKPEAAMTAMKDEIDRKGAFVFGGYPFHAEKARSLPTGYGNTRGYCNAVVVEDYNAAGLKWVGYADEIIDLRHRGWFTDQFEDDKIRGVVVRMSTKGGKRRFLPAVEFSHYTGGTLMIFPDARNIFSGDIECIYAKDEEAARDCAHVADDFAECLAEREREYNEAWDARSRFENAAEEIASIRQTALRVIREFKTSRDRMGENIRMIVCEKIRTMREDMQALRGEREELELRFSDHEGWQAY